MNKFNNSHKGIKKVNSNVDGKDNNNNNLRIIDNDYKLVKSASSKINLVSPNYMKNIITTSTPTLNQNRSNSNLLGKNKNKPQLKAGDINNKIQMQILNQILNNQPYNRNKNTLFNTNNTNSNNQFYTQTTNLNINTVGSPSPTPKIFNGKANFAKNQGNNLISPKISKHTSKINEFRKNKPAKSEMERLLIPTNHKNSIEKCFNKQMKRPDENYIDGNKINLNKHNNKSNSIIQDSQYNINKTLLNTASMTNIKDINKTLLNTASMTNIKDKLKSPRQPSFKKPFKETTSRNKPISITANTNTTSLVNQLFGAFASKNNLTNFNLQTGILSSTRNASEKKTASQVIVNMNVNVNKNYSIQNASKINNYVNFSNKLERENEKRSKSNDGGVNSHIVNKLNSRNYQSLYKLASNRSNKRCSSSIEDKGNNNNLSSFRMKNGRSASISMVDFSILEKKQLGVDGIKTKLKEFLKLNTNNDKKWIKNNNFSSREESSLQARTVSSQLKQKNSNSNFFNNDNSKKNSVKIEKTRELMSLYSKLKKK